MSRSPDVHVEDGQLTRLSAALGDRYRIEREIGAGGMATVYLAHDVKHQRRVAVKVLKHDLAASLGAERFLREIQIAAALTHPNILTLIDSGEADGFLYYVMPYIEGESLRLKLAREGELPVHDAVRVLRDVVDALTEAHAKGVVHRDIKPDNILLAGKHALVSDFGVAKAVSEATGRHQLTTAGVALGTPSYMSPEQATADPHTDHRADLYAIGALGYEMLTGRPPFVGDSPQAVLAAQVTEAPAPVTRYREAVPAPLAQVLMRCLEKKPADRWQTAGELLAQLEAQLTPTAGLTPTDTRPVTAPVAGRRRVGLFAAAVGGVAVLAAAVLLWPRPGAAMLPDRVLVMPFENATGDASLDPIGKVVADWMSRGLHETGLVNVVDARTALDPGALAATGAEAQARARSAARDFGAGTVLTGSYYRAGDSLQFEAQIVNAADGKLIASAGPASTPLASPLDGVAALRERVMGALANALDPRFGATAPGVRPPTYEAYREFMAGDEAFQGRRYEESARYFLRAAAIDTSFAIALVRAAYAFQNLARCAEVDSLGRVLRERRGVLPPYEGQYLERVLARCRGDWAAHLRAAQEMYRLAPKSAFAGYIAGRSALYVNRPVEGLSILEQLDPDRGDLRPNGDFYFSDVAIAYHMLGEPARELDVVRRWQARYPDTWTARWGEIRALVAAERPGEAQGRIRALLTFAPPGPLSPAVMLRDASEELLWHGQPEASRELAGDLVRRLEAPPRDADALAVAMLKIEALALAGDLAAAGRLADSVGDAGLDDWRVSAHRGRLAARRGDRDAASRYAAALAAVAEPYLLGGNTLARAEIAALLGDREEAVRLLREATAQGVSFLGSTIHANPYLESLRGYAPFEELVRPKG